MGRAQRILENSLMSAGEIAAYLLDRCGSLTQFEPYMFGSTLNGVGVDIDILVVGSVGDKLSTLKQELRAASECLPLHVLYMQPAEVQRTGFVTREKCVPLTKLAASVAIR